MVVKVLFIVGCGRSGSTLIDQILGQTPGFCSVGELHTLWTHGLIDGDSCGCGETVRDCAFWRSVTTEAFGAVEAAPAREMAALLDRHARTRPRWLLRDLGGRSQAEESALTRYGAILDRLYRAVASTSGARVIIDSTKVPSHALIAARFASVDLHVVHLVRDPRAVAYSWLRNPDAGGRSERARIAVRSLGVLESMAQWIFRSLFIEVTLRPLLGRRYRQIRYEDFADAPLQLADALLKFIGEARQTRPPFVDDRTVIVGENHILSGNRSKFNRGEVRIGRDDDWRTSMPKTAKWGCVLASWPLLLRYGYPILSRPLSSRDYANARAKEPGL